MKKLALVAVVMSLGLLGLKADGYGDGGGGYGGYGSGSDKDYYTLPPGLTSVHVDMVVLGQGATTETNGVTKFHLNSVNIHDDDILGLINNEYGTAFSVTNGDHLAVSNFWDGKFLVVDDKGNVLLGNASSNTNGDKYHLYFYSTNAVYAGKEATNYETKYSVADGFFIYNSGNGTNGFHLKAYTTVDDSYYNSNSAESYQLCSGIGHLSFPDNGTNGALSGVLVGSVSGDGKDDAPAP
jgi:hypothetical protein